MNFSFDALMKNIFIMVTHCKLHSSKRKTFRNKSAVMLAISQSADKS